ncbi:protein GLUTAMINE DUMPER 5 [Cornus florida]|uniref:protein GLUTAMINE DUMPER 5 n=1 Tax=Cornus florida TaxID=4283 RepID=UPI00289A9B69|nr:protein GLUTAMINE DUMPER 5 [Cornus florida]
MTTTTEALNEPSTAPVAIQRSPWHSPVPYLFGGLAAMLGLIAFALLILACSYWKLSGSVEEEEGDIEAAGGHDANSNSNSEEKEPAPVFVEKLVIMAGQEKPTYLATPISSRASSFGSNTSCCSTSSSSRSEKSVEEGYEKLQNRNTVTHEASDQHPP